jgi:hypothetical protein
MSRYIPVGRRRVVLNINIILYFWAYGFWHAESETFFFWHLYFYRISILCTRSTGTKGISTAERWIFFHSFLPRVEKRIIYARVLRVLNLFLAAVSCLTNQYLFRVAMCQLIRDHLTSAISSSHSDTVFTCLIYSSILIGVFFFIYLIDESTTTVNFSSK